MLKKTVGILLCASIISFCTPVMAHGFTWFGLRKDNTEIFINTGSHPEPEPPGHRPHPKKPKHKPKPKPKHEPCKKVPEHCNCFWWWCR